MLLLPRPFRFIGIGLIIPGVILGIIRFYYGIKLEIFDLTMFTVYSSFLESKYFTFITNNFGEEIPGLLLLIGLFFTALAKEKEEKDEYIVLRLRSFLLAIYINTFLIILSFLFVFGFGFINILVINLYSFLLLYLIIFQIGIRRK